jgi:hypothetical protein
MPLDLGHPVRHDMKRSVLQSMGMQVKQSSRYKGAWVETML